MRQVNNKSVYYYLMAFSGNLRGKDPHNLYFNLYNLTYTLPPLSAYSKIIFNLYRVQTC
jgi:hypothetical protein